jgi:hypothetical protein
MTGYVDRLSCTPEGVWQIHDYKTDKRLPCATANGGRPSPDRHHADRGPAGDCGLFALVVGWGGTVTEDIMVTYNWPAIGALVVGVVIVIGAVIVIAVELTGRKK